MELRVGYKKTEIGVIPEEWDVSTLNSISKIIMGQSPSSLHYNNLAIGLPLVQGNADIKNRKTIIRNYTSQITKTCKENDIIMSVRAPVGEIARAKFDACIGRGVCAIRYFNNYLFHYLVYFEPKWSEFSTGSTFSSVNSDTLKSLKIPLPPLPEQTAIAKVLSDTDNLLQALQKKIAKKRLIKQGAMQELLKPKEGWVVKSLGEIGEGIIGLTYSPNDVSKTGTLVLRSSNVQKGQLSFKDNVYVEMDLPNRVIVKENDILICVRNGSKRLIGKCAIIDTNTEGSAFGAFMTIFRSHYAKFVFYVFQSQHIQKQINEVMGATINQITNKDLNSFEIPFPPEQEQTKITTILSDMDTEIESLEKQLAKYKQVKQGLMQNLLTGKIRLV